MALLYQRKYSIQIGDIDVSKLDIEFSIEKSLRTSSNSAVLKIYNLSRDKIVRIHDEPNTMEVSIAVGYEADSELNVLFRGLTKREQTITSTGPDIFLTINASDGASAAQQRFNKTYPPNTAVIDILSDLILVMGVGQGNLSDFSSLIALPGGSDSTRRAYTVHGAARHQFDRLARSVGLRWSIQGGAMQIISINGNPGRASTVLSAASGLLGAPKPAKGGHIAATSLIQRGLNPGDLIRLQSEFINGDYQIYNTKYTGSTLGVNPKWDADLTLAPLS